MSTLPDNSHSVQAARKPASKIGTLRELLFALLQEHERDALLPTSARFLFYELVTRGQYSKVATGARRADQDLIDALKQLRDEGRVPWEWITDETRSVEDYTGYKTIKEGVLATLPGIGLNPWHYSPPLILTESRSLAGVLRDTVSDCRARIAATNGQCGGFLRTETAPRLRPSDPVIYLGDVYYAHRMKEWPIGKYGALLIASKRRFARHAESSRAALLPDRQRCGR